MTDISEYAKITDGDPLPEELAVSAGAWVDALAECRRKGCAIEVLERCYKDAAGQVQAMAGGGIAIYHGDNEGGFLPIYGEVLKKMPYETLLRIVHTWVRDVHKCTV